LLYFITCSAIWGLTWIAIKFQFNAVDSNVAVFYRFILASVLLFGFALIKKIPLKFNRTAHLHFAAQGFFMFCINYLLTYWASHLAPSALVALAFTSLIYFNMLGGKIFMRIPIEKKVLAGAIVSFAGMIFISINEMRSIDLHPTSFAGFFISLVATVSASAGNLISIRNRKNDIPITTNNAWGMLYGCLFTLVYCAGMQKSFALHNIDTSFVLSFIYLTVFGTVISFGAYLKLMEIYGPSKAAFTSVVSPIIAIAVSVVFEDLPMTGLLTAGVVLCLAGNLIALVDQKNLRARYAN
jgi:drug/metabolite transporter (DMT)-like permease